MNAKVSPYIGIMIDIRSHVLSGLWPMAYGPRNMNDMMVVLSCR